MPRSAWEGSSGSPDPSVVLAEGPWSHRYVATGDVRLHVAEAGEGPLVLLLHGFPQFWWSWRHQLPALAEAGYRAVAPDLRGYGASDKPPGGYDVPTLVDDVAGLVRALGARDAVLVGHDWGGVLAWATAALRPEVVRGLVAVSMPHPLRFRSALLTDPGQVRASSYIARFQLPGAESRLVDDDAEQVAELLHAWGGPGFPDPGTERRYRDAAQVPGVARSALEWYRWAARSPVRPSGVRLLRRLRTSVEAPVLQVHGALDACLLPSTAQGSGRWVRGPYRWRLLEGAGHFPHEEQADVVSAELLRFLDG